MKSNFYDDDEIILNKDRLWVIWVILSVFYLYLFAEGFDQHYNMSVLYLFMVPQEYIVGRLQLGILCGVYAIFIKNKSFHYIKYSMQILLYLLLIMSLLICFNFSVETMSLDYNLPFPLLHYLPLIGSVITLSQLEEGLRKSVWKMVFQIQVIREKWSVLMVYLIGFALLFIALNYSITYILIKSNEGLIVN